MKTSTSLTSLALSLFQWWSGVEKVMAGLYRLYERAPESQVTTLPDHVSLEDGKVIRLRSDSGVQRLRVRRGVLWLTRTPADGDILLKAGEQVDLDYGWPIVVQALEEARVDVWR